MANPTVIECVPNFSEGRDPLVLTALAESIRQTPGVKLLDRSADPDHHRSVFTFIGCPDAVIEGALASARAAVERIDLRLHTGVHPRIGAIDVVPFVPVAGATMQDCVRLARQYAEQLWQTLRIPAFLYEQAAVVLERRPLQQVRRLAMAGAQPDVGEGRHLTAGACAVGARDFLIAWNIWLETADLAVARQIARAIRYSSGGFPGVKALGLPLASQGLVQVSINSTDVRATPLHVVFERVVALARQAGVKVRGSELIGLIPRPAVSDHDLGWMNLSPQRVLDVPN